MTARGRALLILAAGSLLSGLTLGGRIFYLAAIFGALAMLYALLTVVLMCRLLRSACQASPAQALRGESAHLLIRVTSPLPLPVSPLHLSVRAGDTQVTHTLPLRRGRGETALDIAVRHIGVMQAGLEALYVTDILGLFRMRARRAKQLFPLLVLPRSFPVAPLQFLQGDEGRALQNRLTEDLSTPADTRAYRAGDPLKRVHWKLTARRRELIVRRFETPAPPETLILLDCTAPKEQAAQSDISANLRDTLCETALSVAKTQAGADTPVRLPLYGEVAGEFLSDRSGGIALLPEMLARQTFSGGTSFELVLNLELRRMRRTGATVIITSRIDAGVVEGIKHIRRMGPAVRLYYVTHTPEAAEDVPYIAQLQQNTVEVCYVTPA